MRHLIFTFLLGLGSTVLFGQNGPINFEPNGFGANWTWTVFENDTNPPLEIIDNPDPTGINTSSKVAKFTALKEGNPWAGTESMEGNLGSFTWNSNNSIVKIMVWKSVISDVGIKFDGGANPNDWSSGEIKVANTKINEWEELTFDFSMVENPPVEVGGLKRIIIFTDFDLGGRQQDNISYFDNITFSASDGNVSGPTVAAPNPIHDAADVISVFSDAYTNVPGSDFNPDWGQQTVVSQVQIQGNNTLRYGNLNYQGTQLDGMLDVSEMEYLHLDFWTANSTDLKVFMISPGPIETPFDLSVPISGWSSVDIPLSAFSPVDLNNVIQFKFEGNGDIFLDNIYFHKSEGTSSGPNAPINFEPNGFGADWTWTVFENDTNPPLEIIDNPDPNGINTSSKVAKFTALQAGNPWAGTESMEGNLGSFTWNSNNSIVKIMVWKSVISDVGIKFDGGANPNDWSSGEIKVANTKINEWEELTFDFSLAENPPAEVGGLKRIIIFTDFDLNGRAQDNVTYFDNITFNRVEGGNPNVPMVAAPSPTHEAANVISIFSDAYNNVPGTDFNPNWGQATVVTQIDIQGNRTLRYGNLNYQGTQLDGMLDVSEMEYLHLDFWTANSTELKVFIISPGPIETPFDLSVPTSGWSSVDIPLSAFSPVDLNNVIQFKFEGNGDIFLDNIYFYKNPVNTDNITWSKLKVFPNPATSGEIVRLDEDILQYEIISINGQKVMAGLGNVIKIASLQTGAYVLKASGSNGKIYSEKLIIK